MKKTTALILILGLDAILWAVMGWLFYVNFVGQQVIGQAWAEPVYWAARILLGLGVLLAVFTFSDKRVKRRNTLIVLVTIVVGGMIFQWHEIQIQGQQRQDCLSIASDFEKHNSPYAAGIRNSCYKPH